MKIQKLEFNRRLDDWSGDVATYKFPVTCSIRNSKVSIQGCTVYANAWRDSKKWKRMISDSASKRTISELARSKLAIASAMCQTRLIKQTICIKTVHVKFKVSKNEQI